MLAPARLIHAAKFAVPLTLLIWFFAYTSSSPRATYGQVMRKFKNQRTLFVSDFLENEIDGHFDGAPIATMCNSRQWNPDWILQCDSVPEGIGTVRNGHLQCIRLAIEIGAGLILPEIVKRSDHDITKAVPNAKGPIRGVPLDYFFDKEHLMSSLARLCPQMKLYHSIDELANVPSVLNGIKLKVPEDFAKKEDNTLVHGSVVADPHRLGKAVTALIQSKDDGKLRPLKAHLQWRPHWWPVASDPPEFVASFGRLLRVRADARRLAAETLFALRASHGLDLDPRRSRPSAGGNGLARSFLGVRLRTDRDIQVKSPPWPPYVDQAPYFLGLAAEHKVPVVYLAQGAAAENVTAFRERAEELGSAVVTKWDLLEGAGAWAELQDLRALSWDQQSLVDYEVMLRAGLVAGIAHSNFAWNLAARRRSAYGPAVAPNTGNDSSSGPSPGAVGTLQEPQGEVQYQDDYTIIYRAGSGKAAPQNAEAMQLTVWP